MPFNVHLNYNADSNTKTLNYSKVRFKPLIYFESETNFELKLRIKSHFELDPS